ncbi:hypothetical protein PFICI_07821 [Pestalotiopsis fici W106-1]|uniref:DUF5672 domain-containing protein n=1 Tax=Pestalotiopsis fici (strain W106-1 / CGMCC3.15140) TaxID=1229662 RepID=W3X4J1_PESFW|nr:uncharacterized protein PFICI_07821 [Pestalotiopsis fici W106-1]ETS80292.1 hypothetical protein PFICI_07821 [Pestalotiopsis fici W106-1]
MVLAARSSPFVGIRTLTRLTTLLVLSLAILRYTISFIPYHRPQIPSFQNTRSVYNTSKVVLLIEPRPLPYLVPQLLHMISVVPSDWHFVFIGSSESVSSVSQSHSTRYQQALGKLKLMTLPEPWYIESKEGVYRALTDRRFYEEFLPDVEWLLRYDADSILCANSGSSLNDWLGWDWVGTLGSPEDKAFSNGGLSLRKVSTIKTMLMSQRRVNDSWPEDEWFGNKIRTLPGARVAYDLKDQLAIEHAYVAGVMGFYLRDGGSVLPDTVWNDTVWKDPAQRKAIFEYCPELSLIMDMKLEVERCPPGYE